MEPIKNARDEVGQLTFSIRYGMNADASNGLSMYSSASSAVNSSEMNSNAFNNTDVFVSKNRRLNHFNIRSSDSNMASFELPIP